MKWMSGVCTLLLAFAGPVFADDRSALESLLHEFMAGASANDAAAHDRFWSKELVYTSSDGSRFGKAEIMSGLQQAATAEDGSQPAVVYTAEDVDIRLYGHTAVVAFRLIGNEQEYYNTGTFFKRDRKWKAVAWQATKIPPSAD